MDGWWIITAFLQDEEVLQGELAWREPAFSPPLPPPLSWPSSGIIFTFKFTTSHTYLNIIATTVSYFRISGFCTNWSQRHTDWVLSQDTLIFININSQQYTNLNWISQDQSSRCQPRRCHTPSSLPLVLLGFKRKSQKVPIQCENNIKAYLCI